MTNASLPWSRYSSCQPPSLCSGGSANFAAGSSESLRSNAIAGITTTEALTVNVGGTTTVTGGVIGSESGALDLTTNRLVLNDLIERERSRQVSLNGSFGASRNDSGGSEFNVAGVGGSFSRSALDGTTRATIGEGSVTVTGQSAAETNAQLAGTNRDLDNVTTITRDTSFDTGDVFIDVGAARRAEGNNDRINDYRRTVRTDDIRAEVRRHEAIRNTQSLVADAQLFVALDSDIFGDGMFDAAEQEAFAVETENLFDAERAAREAYALDENAENLANLQVAQAELVGNLNVINGLISSSLFDQQNRVPILEAIIEAADAYYQDNNFNNSERAIIDQIIQEADFSQPVTLEDGTTAFAFVAGEFDEFGVYQREIRLRPALDNELALGLLGLGFVDLAATIANPISRGGGSGVKGTIKGAGKDIANIGSGVVRVAGQTIKLGRPLGSVKNLSHFTLRSGQTARVVKVGGKGGLISRFINDTTGSVKNPFAFLSQTGLGRNGLTTQAVLKSGEQVASQSKNSIQDATVLGKALAKHAAGQRGTGTFPQLAGTQAKINAQAREIATEILNNPVNRAVVRTPDTIQRFGEPVVHVTGKNNLTLRFGQRTNIFIGFFD